MESLLTQLEWPNRDFPCFQGPVVHRPALQPLFRQLFQALDCSADRLMSESLLLEVMAQLLQHHGDGDLWSPTPPEPDAVALGVVTK
jgi:hypothetical protein